MAEATPLQLTEVTLHLYDVGKLPALRRANDFGATLGIGALHAGVEVCTTLACDHPARNCAPPWFAVWNRGAHALTPGACSGIAAPAPNPNPPCTAQVHGIEVSFAHHEAGGTGIIQYSPKRCAEYRFRESIAMGSAAISKEGLEALLRELRPQWPASGYDLLRRNCCT